MHHSDTETTSRGKPRSQRCTGKSTRTGEPCKRWAIRGAKVCSTHGGGLPVVKAAAARRVALWEALELVRDGQGRPPWVVLLESMAANDVITRDLRDAIIEKKSATQDEIDQLVIALEKSARLAKMALDSQAIERMSHQSRVDGEVIGTLLNRALAIAADESQLPDRPIPPGTWTEALAYRIRGAIRLAIEGGDAREPLAVTATVEKTRPPRDAAKVRD